MSGKKKILVVDDEVDLTELIAGYLSDNGFETQTAFDGVAAKKLILTNDYDLIVTDVMMPKMSGVDLLKFLQGVEESPPIIVITGFADKTEDEFKALGATAVFHKPIEHKELLKTVKSVTGA